MTKKAQAWANNLGSSCQFFHSNLNHTKGARAENIASVCGTKPAGTAPVKGWENSPGHRKNVRISRSISPFPIPFLLDAFALLDQSWFWSSSNQCSWLQFTLHKHTSWTSWWGGSCYLCIGVINN